MSHVVFDTDKCKGCGYCVAKCPLGLLQKATGANALGYQYAEQHDSEGKCTACGICYRMCPDAAISVYRD